MDGLVHDVADFLNNHPGGIKILAYRIGKDATIAFNGGLYRHTKAARNVAALLRVARYVFSFTLLFLLLLVLLCVRAFVCAVSVVFVVITWYSDTLVYFSQIAQRRDRRSRSKWRHQSGVLKMAHTFFLHLLPTSCTLTIIISDTPHHFIDSSLLPSATLFAVFFFASKKQQQFWSTDHRLLITLLSCRIAQDATLKLT